MPRLALEITMDNAAFFSGRNGDEWTPEREVVRILRDLIDAIDPEAGADILAEREPSRPLKDIAGNTVGAWNVFTH